MVAVLSGKNIGNQGPPKTQEKFCQKAGDQGYLKTTQKYIDLWKEFASMNSFDIFSNIV